jgi:hypothetical protein
VRAGSAFASELRRGEQRRLEMMRNLLSIAAAVLVAASGIQALAQKPGGILRIYHWDSPASMSIHEENTYSTVVR